jgi:uncharacterized protein (TIGR01777 family)
MSGATVLERSTSVDRPVGEVWDWHTRPGALERLIPPWDDVRVLERNGDLGDSGRVVLEVRRGPLRRRWVAAHDGVEPGRRFRDVQLEGPFRRWAHDHDFTSIRGGCRVTDRVEYELPALAAPGARYVQGSLERMFAFRHRRLRDDLARHADVPPLRVGITGATGTIGGALAAFLTSGGHEVVRIVRRSPEARGEVRWSPSSGEIDTAGLEGLDAVIHLSGRRIDTRWTTARRREIRASRVESTALLAKALASLEAPPRVLLSGSAIGVYGDRGDEELDESSAPGQGFLADLCRDWEAAAEPARAAGIRVVSMRTAVVLSARSAPLARLVLPTRLGLGAVVGRGEQPLSWISLDDLLGAVLHIVCDERLEGPVNLASPSPVSLRELADTLASIFRRPRLLRVPEAAVAVTLGQMGRETILAGQRVAPRRLLDRGFRFFYPTLEDALRHELGRTVEA